MALGGLRLIWNDEWNELMKQEIGLCCDLITGKNGCSMFQQSLSGSRNCEGGNSFICEKMLKISDETAKINFCVFKATKLKVFSKVGFP
jgi:hypothetical protein